MPSSWKGLLLFTLLTVFTQTLSFHKSLNKVSFTRRDLQQAEPFIEKIKDTLFPSTSKEDDQEKSELDIMREKLEVKPWRDRKVKYLKYNYKPWRESYRERFAGDPALEDTIYFYGIPESRPQWDRTRIMDVWNFPWLWTKVKADRLSYLHKMFYADVTAMTVQEHMEMDNFYAEFDMPVRWGILRIKEMDVLNVICLNLVFFTDFNGVKPTDLGLRPDGTVRTCPVQFHTCISSSNDPKDTEHYAPPLKWSISKSPEQAYDEIKSVYLNYPKRGLRWSSGWIDRGGWKPQLFGDSYFYANADSLVWHYTEDIEMSLDVEKRQVQYRSSARLGQTDWDVEKLRYNQFVKMLTLKGGWEIAPLEKDLYIFKTPYRWTDLLLTKASSAVEKLTSDILKSDLLSDRSDDFRGKREELDRLQAAIEEFLRPFTENIDTLVEKTLKDTRVRDAVRLLEDIQKQLKVSSSLEFPELKSYIDRFSSILPGEVAELLQRYTTEKGTSSQVYSKLLTESDYESIETDSRGLADEEEDADDKRGLKDMFFKAKDIVLPEGTSKTDHIIVPSDEFKRLKERDDSRKEQLQTRLPWLKNIEANAMSNSRQYDGGQLPSKNMNAAEIIIESF